MAESTYPASTLTPQVSSPTTDASTMQVTLPAEAFALANLFDRVPDARVECESAVANPADYALVAVRTDGHERAVATALRSDPGVAAVERFGEHKDGWTYRVTWEGCPHQLIQRLVAADVTLLSAQGQSGEWKFRLLAPDREGIARADEIMRDLDCEADCRSISTVDSECSSRWGLTTGQRDALVTVFEEGYYNVPRDITATELADDLGISHQALSERLRRAHYHLVETELIVTEDEDEQP